MTHNDDLLFQDIEKVKKIPIVPTLLEVICRTTEMGFAAIARVTQDRWIACSVKDEIQFGLQPGDELQIKTTICNEIRDSKKAVIIDHVAKDEIYCHHHTPKIYGFQSYISVPIFLKNNEFFGTLCAIDPNPAQLNNPKIIGLFNLFAELIAFHLHSVDLMERSDQAIQDLNRQLEETTDENRQYRYISDHNLQEPLRKIRMFSSLLVNAAEMNDLENTKRFALKINSGAQKFSMMIKDLSDFSRLKYSESSFEPVDLNTIVRDVCAQLRPQLNEINAVVKVENLPIIKAIPLQIEQLFFHLIHNAVNYVGQKENPLIRIYSKGLVENHPIGSTDPNGFAEICLEDNGIGIEQSQLETIFDIFSRLPYDQIPEGNGIGLSYCRKIVRNHGGTIKATSEVNKGTLFSLILPLAFK